MLLQEAMDEIGLSAATHEVLNGRLGQFVNLKTVCLNPDPNPLEKLRLVKGLRARAAILILAGQW